MMYHIVFAMKYRKRTIVEKRAFGEGWRQLICIAAKRRQHLAAGVSPQ